MRTTCANLTPNPNFRQTRSGLRAIPRSQLRSIPAKRTNGFILTQAMPGSLFSPRFFRRNKWNIGNSVVQVYVCPLLASARRRSVAKANFLKLGARRTKKAQIALSIFVSMQVSIFFDTANGYSAGMAEEILGGTIQGRREKMLIATKTTFSTGTGRQRLRLISLPNHSLVRASLRRLKTDYVDLFYLHGFDSTTPIEEKRCGRSMIS